MSQAASENAQTRALLERCGCAMAVLTPHTWQLELVSDRYLELLQTPRDSVDNLSVFELWTSRAQVPCNRETLRSALTKALATQQPTLYLQSSEDELSSAYMWLERISPIIAEDGTVSQLVHVVEGPFRDTGSQDANIVAALDEQARRRSLELEETNARLLRETAEHLKTDRALQRMEEQLRQAQKMDALGRLAGGVAHDFNNLLSVILGYSSSLYEEGDITPPVRLQVGEIKMAAERAADLTMQLLAFSRGQVLAPQVVDINGSLARLEKMLRRLVGEDVELRLVLNPQVGKVRVDPGQIEQVVMNLVINARDAMPTGGSVIIETENAVLDEEFAREHVQCVAGSYVMVSVSDTGCGMDKATQARIFEPFFTTKGPGKGTGLGLATAFGIVKQSGGSIWVYSEVGRGTSFKVYLPRVLGSSDAPPRTKETNGAPGGDERILVVEDDTQVRRLVCSVLRGAGYHVIEAPSPEDALRWSSQEAPQVDLLLTDVVMPKVSGRQLAEQLIARVPSLRVLYMSGYTDDAVLRHGIVELGSAFLQKPLTPFVLLRKVREVLDEERVS